MDAEDVAGAAAASVDAEDVAGEARRKARPANGDDLLGTDLDDSDNQLGSVNSGASGDESVKVFANSEVPSTVVLHRVHWSGDGCSHC